MSDNWICKNCCNLSGKDDKYVCLEDDGFDFEVEFVTECVNYCKSVESRIDSYLAEEKSLSPSEINEVKEIIGMMDEAVGLYKMLYER